MKIIKLHTTPSTNSFLKELSSETRIENFTVVVTEEQTAGRGQMQTKWQTKTGKNLIMSVFCSFENLLIEQKKYLNFAVAVSVFEAISMLKVPRLAIKWPNDILSASQKICGILIENQLKGSKIASSIIGIGLNVNQESFPADIGKATSLKNVLDQSFSLDDILYSILDALQKNINLLNTKKYQKLEEKYLSNLYRKDLPSMFKNIENELFMGKIVGISSEGNLQIELEDETVKEFGLKEVSFV